MQALTGSADAELLGVTARVGMFSTSGGGKSKVNNVGQDKH